MFWCFYYRPRANLHSNVSHVVFNLFQPSLAFQIETSYLNQMTGFYMKYNTGLVWVEHAVFTGKWTTSYSVNILENAFSVDT